LTAEAFFLPVAGGGQRYCLFHAPAGEAVRGAVLHLHPWAEEMNKSRRMAALQARAFAAAGFAVLQFDLYGCGDSSGDFADASWAGWLADVHTAADWLAARHPAAPLTLWGQRAGCLLATAAAATMRRPCRFLFWQPPASGKLLLQQFLRLRAAAEMAGGDSKAVLDGVRRELAAGRAVDIAGYALPAALAQGLEAATLEAPARASQVAWLEVSAAEEAALLPASLPRIEAWRAAGHAVHAQVVRGPAFWQTTEIEDAPRLIDASLAALLA
jgi:uncharacterized protein